MTKSSFKVVFPRASAVAFQPQDELTPSEGGFVFETHRTLISPGTELAFYNGTHIGLQDPHNTWASYPFEPGYAAVGRVVAAGKGGPEVNPDALYFTAAPHATHSSIEAHPEKFLLPIPAGLPPERAVFCRFAAIAATALALAPVEAGARVVMLGGGLVGNLAAQHFRLAGARVAVVETNAARGAIAQRCGLGFVAAGEGLRARLHEVLGGEADVAVEATGVPALLNQALELVRGRGRVVLLGAPRGLSEIDAYKHLFGRGVQMTGARESLQGTDGLPTRFELTRRSLDLIAQNELKIEPLLTQILPAERIQDAYEMLIHEQDRALGIVLDWHWASS